MGLENSGGKVLCFAGYEFDPQRAELRGPDGEAIRLRPKSFDMLQLFAANPGRVLSKHDLIAAVWPNVHVSDDSVFQCIREIRAALGDDHRQLIKLVSGRGYLFDANVSNQLTGAGATSEPSSFAAGPEEEPAADPANGEPDLRADPDAKVAPAKQRPRFNLRGPPGARHPGRTRRDRRPCRRRADLWARSHLLASTADHRRDGDRRRRQ
jgi:DNA-binding winged helix-turn-helix (wHTH) protein